MVRVKRGTTSIKHRRKILKLTKGFRWGAKSKERQAKERLLHAGLHSFHDRRKKKRVMRKLWNIQINAAARQHGFSYSKFIDKLKKADIEINRKILSELAQTKPEAFQAIVEQTKKV